MIDKNKIQISEDGTATWAIEITTKLGQTYQGVFQFRTILTPMQLIEADRDYRDLIGKNAEFASSIVENLSYILTQLKQRIIKSPPFWNAGSELFPGGQIKDNEVLNLVFEAAMASEDKFRQNLNELHKKSLEKIKAALEKAEADAVVDAELGEDAPAKKRKKAKDSP